MDGIDEGDAPSVTPLDVSLDVTTTSAPATSGGPTSADLIDAILSGTPVVDDAAAADLTADNVPSLTLDISLDGASG